MPQLIAVGEAAQTGLVEAQQLGTDLRHLPLLEGEVLPALYAVKDHLVHAHVSFLDFLNI